MESTEGVVTTDGNFVDLRKNCTEITQATDRCIVFDVNTTVPWNNPNNLISSETEYLINRITTAVLIPILFLIGLPANCLNMLVFYRQGLKDRIILCLFSLSFVDLIYITFLFLMYAERTYSQFTTGERYGTVFRFLMNQNVVGLYGFGYASMFLSATISCERCFCVLFPLRSQLMLETKTMAVIVVVSVSVIGFLRFAVTAQYQVACFFDQQTTLTSTQIYVSEYYFKHRQMLRWLDGIFYGFVMTVGCPLVVLVTTTITAVKLRQTIVWRRQTTTNMSNKEAALTKMLICLSAEFFVLSIPFIGVRVTPVFVPQLGSGGEYANTFLVMISVGEFCSYANSSVNFFVNYFTGSRYQKTLHDIVNVKRRPKNTASDGQGLSTPSVKISIVSINTRF
ncbi:hypothetical protein BaRGS_00002835 [Batillaria attramentaria]|uniref:G-protein coupled receptors family 1 profile domain-containing protein n=1 Tax=Batillaria attramentaria TaxID=370345 RepID=A0ABD0M3Z9_9CAEN